MHLTYLMRAGQGLPRRQTTYESPIGCQSGAHAGARRRRVGFDARHERRPGGECCRCGTASRRCRSSPDRTARRRPGADRRVFARSTRAGRAAARRHLDFDARITSRAFEGRRRNVTVTLCGTARRTPMHVVAVGGRDQEARAALDAAAVGPPREGGSHSWRYESCFKDFGEAMAPSTASSRDPCPRAAGGAARAASRCRSCPRRGAPRHGRCSPRTAATTSSRPSSGSRSTARSTTSTSRTPQLHRRRARHPQLDLRVPWRRHQEHPRLRGRLPRRPRRQARAELPLDADDPRRPTRSWRTTAGGWQVAVDRHRRGRPDQGPRAGRRARRGAVRGRGDRADGRRGRQSRRDRRLLPDQRAVAGARGHAGAGADRLPGDRRHEVLRARGDQGRGRVPDVPGQPAGRQRVHADRQLAAARAGADVAVARARARRHDGDPGLGGRRRPRLVPGLGTAAQKALGRFMSTMERLRERVEGGAPVGDLLERGAGARPATPRRWRPSGRSRRRAGSRTSRSSSGSPASTTRPPRTAARSASSCSRSRCSPTPTRAATTRAS